MAKRYVGADSTSMTTLPNGGKKILDLLWGDCARTLDTSGDKTKVRARGVTGWVKTADLDGESLLEVYFIDVGQGDGVLIRTPDDRHILIDGGYIRSQQPTGKNAADFVDWKFFRDYAGKSRNDDGSNVTISLDAMIASHCDADHYGGLWDLLNPAEIQRDDLDSGSVSLDAFYHAGISWWRSSAKPRFLGETATHDGKKYLTRLLGANLAQALNGTNGVKLQGQWAEFIQCVHDSGCTVGRLSRLAGQDPGYVPGFSPDDGPAALRVLGPIEYRISSKPALRSLGSDSQNTNGNSLVLRLDYGQSRILLTGDLNAAAQRELLENYRGNLLEFQCDVAKGCHHGSDDVSYEFLRAMSPSVTVISSGDSEGHGHPRPSIVAASAVTGHLLIEDDKLISPLIYCTEIARSYRLGNVQQIGDLVTSGSSTTIPNPVPRDGSVGLEVKAHAPGELNPSRSIVSYEPGLHIVSGVTYGLVNVRTDGSKILCATRDEKNAVWDIKTIQSRF